MAAVRARAGDSRTTETPAATRPRQRRARRAIGERAPARIRRALIIRPGESAAAGARAHSSSRSRATRQVAHGQLGKSLTGQLGKVAHGATRHVISKPRGPGGTLTRSCLDATISTSLKAPEARRL